MKIGREIAGGDGVEVVVVAVNPVDGRADGFVAAACPERSRGGVGCEVPDAEPERDVGAARDDLSRRVERAVDVA
jgi:hypothetical protein